MAIPSTAYDIATITNPSSALTDFTLIVDLSRMSTAWWTAVNTSDGTRGRAAKNDGTTELAADWIDFNSTAETGFLRVKWTGTLASTGTQIIRIYPPNTANTAYGASEPYGQYNAYPATDKGIYPVTGDSGTTLTDRTSNGEDGTLNAGVSFLNDQLDFTTSSATVDVMSGKLLDGAANFTLSFELNFDNLTGDNMFCVFDVFGFNEPVVLWASGVDLLAIITTTGGTTGIYRPAIAFTNNVDCRIDIVYDGSNINMYKDGAYVENTPLTGTLVTTGSANYKLGRTTGSIDGQMWDVKFKTTADSAAFVALDYAQTNDNATFWGTWVNVPVSGLELDAESGVYNLTGSDVSTPITRLLSAETGSYSLTGSDIGVTLDRILSGESGAFVLTGSDVEITISLDKTLNAESGAYNLTGSEVNIVKDAILNAETGAFNLTGAEVDILKQVVLSAESGAYSLTGSDTDIKKTSVLNAESGAYVLTGSDVSIIWSGAAVIQPPITISMVLTVPNLTMNMSVPSITMELKV